jgi:hypothetical protein
MDKPLQQVIAEKSGLLNNIIQHKFGGNPDAAADSGQETQTGGGNTMKVTRSQSSGAPGQVTDGKLVDVKNLAAAAARQDVPPTDLLALARANDPHNEDTIPVTIAGAVTAGDKGLPGQSVSEDHSKDMGNIDKEVKDSLHSKQHKPTMDAVNTDVESQLTDKDPYKSLHASQEIDDIVSRAAALLNGGDKLRAIVAKTAATEVKEHPGEGEVEDGGQGKAGADADKNAVDSAKTLGNGGGKSASLGAGTKREDVLAAVKAEIERRRTAKVEGALEDPVSGGSDAAKSAEESAKTLGDGGSQKGASNAAPAKTAESKDRPLASMPEGKPRYQRDEDGRDDEAASYWKKNQADEKRFDKEPAEDRPITKELQEKMPKLSSASLKRLSLLTRVAGLKVILAESEDEAARLHLKRREYKKDTPKDMDYGGAAIRTESEISKEHRERASDKHTFSPNMSKLWSAYGPVKTAADTGYTGKLEKAETRAELNKQLEELRSALKGLKAEDSGADGQMSAMHSKIESLESELSKASGLHCGLKATAALASALDRLAVVAEALSDANRLCVASHVELRFSEEKPHGSGVSDSVMKLLEDLGETFEEMASTIGKSLKDMGHPGLPEKKGPPSMKKEDELPPKPEGDMGGDMGGGLPPGLDMGAANSAPVKTAFETEDEQVEKVASDPKLSAEEKVAKVEELRKGSEWKAQLTKVPSKADASKADILASYWEVLRNGEAVLKVSLQDAYPVKTAADQEKAFAWFATKDYGRKLLASAKHEGLGKTAKLLGLTFTRKAEYSVKRPDAGPALDDGKGKKIKDEKGYYAKAYGSPEFASELTKNYESKAASASVEISGLKAKVATLEKEKQAEKERNDRLEKDITMRAKASRALALANVAISKGLLQEEKKAAFIDNLMVGDDKAFQATSRIIDDFTKSAAAAPVEEKKGTITAKELVRMASAGPGLKTAAVLPASNTANGFGGLKEQLDGIWRKPPTA